MKLHAGLTRSKAVLAPSFLGLVLAVPAPQSPARQSVADNAELGKTRSRAATQHEIVVLLLEKKEFEKAASEAGKIFEMKWPPDQEQVLLRELLFFSDQFLHRDQAHVALLLLDKNMKWFKSEASQAAIWKDKGYLFKRMNQMDKALDCFREAQRLEKSNQ